MATVSLGFDNFYTSTLSSGITSSDTTIYLNALPTATEGYIVLEPDSSTAREIIYYTSKGANFVTLPSAAAGRGVGATTAQSHSSGVTAQMNVVAEHFEALQDGTGISNTAITAAKIANIATNTTAISNPYKFAAYNAVDQTGVGNGVITNLTLGTEEFDTNNNFTGGTYTVPVTGFYMLIGVVSYTGSAGLILGSIGGDIYKNGTTSILQSPMAYDNNTSYDAVTCAISGIVSLTAGNTIRLRGVGTVSSGSFAFNAGIGNRFSGFLVSQT